MAYVHPETVLSPRSKVGRIIEIIYDAGPVASSWAAAIIEFDGERRLALRWNGDDTSHKGNPQSRGQPTWFTVPEPVADSLEKLIREKFESSDGELAARYREMAADTDRESEAAQWSEGLLSDALDPKG
jgi:hypothetical protein